MRERGLFQGLVVHAGENGVAAVDHFELQVELQAFEMADLPLAVLVAEGGFGSAPFFQCFGGNVELFGGVLQVAVVLVELVEGVDFVVEGVSSFHGWVVLYWMDGRNRLARMCYEGVNI